MALDRDDREDGRGSLDKTDRGVAAERGISSSGKAEEKMEGRHRQGRGQELDEGGAERRMAAVRRAVCDVGGASDRVLFIVVNVNNGCDSCFRGDK